MNASDIVSSGCDAGCIDRVAEAHCDACGYQIAGEYGPEHVEYLAEHIAGQLLRASDDFGGSQHRILAWEVAQAIRAYAEKERKS